MGGIDAQLGPFLLDVIDQQSQHGSLLITSQYPKEKWYDLFADPTIADAILDRIVHKSHVIQLKGESMRRVRSRKR
ncbi:ATP-binding protein [Pseudomonas sp. BGI-2]|uniref:ATP-binding protein n=1 Tax=Pseudomonas sp. BGI-2 TaxID=2528211 RepID=UPI0021153653|nr:ATP-binding protein [Pseudomonas sp. BGI-2]